MTEGVGFVDRVLELDTDRESLRRLGSFDRRLDLRLTLGRDGEESIS